MTSQFPASPLSGSTYWLGDSLYEYNLANKDWTIKYDLTPIHHWRLNEPYTLTSNLITNSSFDSVTTGWVGVGAITLTRDTAVYKTAPAGLLLSNNTSTAYVEQTLTVVSGATYKYDAWALGTSTCSFNIGRVSGGSNYLSSTVTSDIWTNKVGTFVADTTTCFVNWKPQANTLSWIDDIYMWQVNGSSIANDSGSNPIAGSITACVLNQTGKIDKCIWFTGTGTYIKCTNISRLNKYASCMGWIYQANTSASYQYMGVFDDQVVALGVRADGSNYLGTIQGGVWNTFTTATPAKGAWAHLAYIFNDSSTSVYVDGSFKETRTGLTPLTSVASFYIGSNQVGTGNLNGYLEDIRIYNRALTSGEVSAIYERGRGTYSQSLIKGYPTVKEPVFHYRLNELTGAVANNKGSISLSGPIDTGVQINQTGIIGKCMSFPQTSTSNIIVPNAGNFMSVTTQISMSTWVKWSGTNDNLGVTAFATGGNNYGAFSFFKYLQKTAIFLGGAYSTLYYPMSTTNWCHYAFTADGTNAKLYVNGNFQTQTAYSSAFNFTNLNLEIGRGGYAAASYVWNGSIEDLRYYNYPLSETEIRNIYNNGKGTYL